MTDIMNGLFRLLRQRLPLALTAVLRSGLPLFVPAMLAKLALFNQWIGVRYMEMTVVDAVIACGTLLLLSGWTLLLPVRARLVSLALLNVCSTFYSVAVSSSLLQLVNQDQIQRAGSLNQMASSAGNILAPVLGGILYAFLPLSVFTLMNGAAFLVSTIVTVLLIFRPETARADAVDAEADAGAAMEAAPAGAKPGTIRHMLAAMRSDLSAGFAYVRTNPAVSTLLKFVFWINFFMASLGVLLPYVVVQTLNLSSEQFGTIEAMEAVGVLLMSLIMSIRKQSKDHVRPLARGLYIMSVLLLAVALPLLFSFNNGVNFVYYMAVMLAIGVSIISVNIPLSVFMQTTIDEQYRGRVFGLVDTFAGAIVPLGMLIVGYLVDLVPLWTLPVVSGVAVAVITFFGHRNLRKHTGVSEPKSKATLGSGIVQGGEVGV